MRVVVRLHQDFVILDAELTIKEHSNLSSRTNLLYRIVLQNGHRRKVLFVLPSLRSGGEERVAVHLLKHLDRRRFAPMLALGAVEGERLGDVPEDVPVHDLGSRRALTAVPAIVKIVRSLRADTVFAFLGMNFGVALARPSFPRETRVVVREGSTASAYLSEVAQSSRARAAAYGWSHRILYRLVDKVVCQSEYMLNDLATNFSVPRRKLTCIYNPIDVESIKELAKEGETQYDGNGTRLLTIGNMTYAKGYDILIEAFALVRKQYPEATLTVIGDDPGGNRPALESQLKTLGLRDAVRFLGFLENPFAYLKQADLFVSSSRYEGLSMVVLEAFACGAPVVATDCPSGNREVIEEGVNGWLAKTENVESLAATICHGIKQHAQLDRRAIRVRCEERFSVERITGEYEALF